VRKINAEKEDVREVERFPEMRTVKVIDAKTGELLREIQVMRHRFIGKIKKSRRWRG